MTLPLKETPANTANAVPKTWEGKSLQDKGRERTNLLPVAGLSQHLVDLAHHRTLPELTAICQAPATTAFRLIHRKIQLPKPPKPAKHFARSAAQCKPRLPIGLPAVPHVVLHVCLGHSALTHGQSLDNGRETETKGKRVFPVLSVSFS